MNQELIVSDHGVITNIELDKNVATAKAYPRNIDKAIENAITLATLDEATAQSCFYCLARKDKDGNKKEIIGKSIRLAEIIASCWGNLRLRTRLVSNDGRVITAAGRAWDLESNNDFEMEHEVSIWFGEKNGKPGYQASADMQTMLSNSAKAKALRNAIFKAIPDALANKVLERAIKFAIGDQKTINSKVSEIFDKLIKMGIEKQRILDYYSYENISQITGEDFKSLIGVGTAIKEGHLKIEDAFSKIESKVTSESDDINEKLGLNEKKESNKEWLEDFNKETGEIKK